MLHDVPTRSTSCGPGQRNLSPISEVGRSEHRITTCHHLNPPPRPMSMLNLALAVLQSKKPTHDP
ncbi:hypothetical protein C8R44DRAFT_806101 [Mycena epipterygia]|nr:hypothetical protein C8R44DRAFT_806101 [Mycena epipterygia]